MAVLTLWFAPRTRAVRVRWLLLADGDVVICESGAIVEYARALR